MPEHSPHEFHLTAAQDGVWFAQRLDPRSPKYNIAECLEIHGALDEGLLVSALARAIGETDAVRAEFFEVDGAPFQRVADRACPPRLLDLSGEPDPAAAAEQFMARDLATAFDLSTPVRESIPGRADGREFAHEALFRFVVIRLAPELHYWYSCYHHLVIDGMGGAVFSRRVAQVYAAALAGAEPEPAAASPLSRLIEDEDAYRGSKEYKRDRVYWADRFADGPGEAVLPVARRAGSTADAGGCPERDHGAPVAPEVLGGMRALAGANATTWPVTFVAAVALYVARAAGSPDVTLGLATNGRRNAVRGVVGMTANIVPLRLRVEPETTVGALVKAVGAEMRGALQHRRYSREQLVRDVKGAGPAGRLGAIVVNILHYDYDLELGQAPTTSRMLSAGPVEDISVYIRDRGEDSEPKIGLEANPELYLPQDLLPHRHGITGALAALAAADPQSAVAALDFLDAENRADLLETGRGAQASTATESLAALFDRSVEAAGVGAVAVCGDGGELTYGELDERARVLAGVLAGAGVGSEDAVGVLLERSAAVVVSTVGIVRAGAAYVPFDARWPVERIRAAASIAGVKAVVTDGALRNHPWLAALDAEIPVFELDSSGALTGEGLKTAEPETLPYGGERLAYAMFTSGSTGEPKAVGITHADVAALAFDHAWDDGIGEAVLMHSPHAFDASTFEIWTPLLHGGRIIIPPTGALEADTLRDLVTRYEVAAMFMTTALFNTLAEQDPTVFSGLRMLCAGGEAATPDLMQRIAATCPNTTVCHVYGPTETTTFTTLHRVHPDTNPVPPIGRALNGMRLYVLDSALKLVPPGAVGELYIAGHGLARGYLNRSDLTASRFVPDLFANDGSRMYRTGDLVRWTTDTHSDSDAIEYVGRVDRQIKLRGFRIELGEIENVLLAQPEINAACVLLREDRPGDKRLVAYLAASTDADVELGALRTTLGEALPPYMIPAAFVTLPSLPLTPNGKIDRRALPAPDLASGDTPRRAPGNPREEILCTLFADVLGLAEIGVDDNFFDLGGHSLLATRLASRVRTTLNTDITVRTIFDHPTVLELAAATENARPGRKRLLPAERPETVPLSPAQQRLWFLNRLDGPSATYNVPIVLRLVGELNVDALDAALHDLIERHETLRTTFPEYGGRPQQLILPPGNTGFALQVLEATGPAIRGLADRITTEPFDVLSDTPIRATLLNVGEDDHTLILVIHHIAADGWSLAPLARDLEAAYGSRTRGRAPDWQPLPVQYADFTLWQAAGLGTSDEAGSIAAAQLAHWREHLADLPELLDLPYDHPRPAAPTYQGDAVTFQLAPDLHDALTRLARDTDTSLFMVLQAAVAILLSKHGAGTDIPLGTPIAGRTDQALDQLVGFFVNSLVLRTDLSGDPSIRELLTRIRTYDLEAYEHQELPFEQLVEHLNPSRAGSHHPLFQTMLVLQNQDSGTFALPGLTVEAAPPQTGISKFDLTFGFTPERGALGGELEYSTELFTRETAAALVSRLIDLLAEIAARPDARVSALEVTSAQERAELLACGRGARAVVPEDSLADLFDRSVQAVGAGNVAVCGDGIALTYGELDERARVLAGVLAGAGVGAADAVGVLLERSAAVVVSTVGIVRAGAVYVPFDARWPVERIRAAAHTAGIKAVVTDGASRRHPWLVELDAEIPVFELDSSGVVIGEDLKTAEPETLPYGGERLAYAMFTSGSTGEPKAVAITHADVAALAFDHAWDDGVGSAVLMHSPYAFDASTFELWTPLLRGGRIVIPPAGALELETLREVVTRYEVTAMFLTAALFASLAEQDPAAFAGLRIVCAGGEAATPGAMEAVAAACPDTAVCNVYGPTETTTFTTLHRVRSNTDTDSDTVLPIGRALDGMHLYILDSDLNLVPHGATGELYIAGHGLARGYLNRPDLTAGRFVPDPFTNDGSRMYRTGDLVRWTENNDIAYIGRVDRQIKLRGFRIEPGEVENALASRPEIGAACVLLREDRPGDKRLVAYLAADTRLNLPALRTTLAETLPSYMIPSAFVTLPQLPLTPNGKIDRKALPAPDNASSSDTPRRAPSNAREEILCTLFADVLGLAEVGIDENFFDLGGHSLLATRLTSRIRTTLQAEITVRTIFDHPTIHDLAAAIETARPGRKPLLAAERPEIVPLSPAQQRLWFIDRLDGPRATYNVPIVLGLRGDLDVSALDAALRDLIERHESLRTVFPETADGQPRQLILDTHATGFELHVLDATECQVRELTDRIIAEPFDVLSETPIRATLLHDTNTDTHTLVLVIHHIAADGWSLAPLARDLETAYSSRTQGQAPGWTPLPVQYADFTLWQHELLGASDDADSIAATQLAHWREHLADLPELLELPYDHPRPTAPTHQGDAVTFQLAPELHDALTRLARETDTSLFMVLQAAVAILLGKHGAGTDIPLGTPIAGRTDQALDQLVGFFVNSLVLRTDLSGDPSIRELLTRIRTYDLEAYEHQELPFEQLVEHLNPSRAGNHHPLFQTMLVLQNQQSEVFALPGLTVEAAPPRTGVSKFDLTFAFTPEHGALGGGLEYSTELFTRETAAALVSRLIDLLAEIAARPDARVSALEVTSPQERARLLACGRGARAIVPEESLSELFDRSVEATGAGAVAVCADDGVALTYGELDERARVLAGVLAGAGVGPEDAVGVLLERSAAVVVSTVGIVRAGAAYVPFDSRWPVERIRAAAHTVGIKAVVTDGGLRSHPWLAALELPVFELDSSGVLVDEDLKTAEPDTSPSSGECLAYAMFTSGSTGEPKAVAITHADVAALAFDHVWDDGIGKTILMHSPHAFDASTYELWTPLLRGGRIIIPPAGALEADTLRDAIKAHAVSAMFMTTALFNTLAEQDPTVFSGLRMLCAGGEAATPDLMQRIATACPDTTICHVYGPTETTTFTTLHVVRPETDAMPPIGRALDGMRLYILDSDLNLVPHGATGELYIAGHGLARGYLNRPDLTAGRFVPDLFANDGSRMYRTGDLARWTENNDIAYIGRVDRQIKLRGFRIELGEIENALLTQPEINAACVLLREDRPGDKRLVAYLAANTDVAPGALRTTLAETLPPYMIPSAFVTLPQLPLTPNGKIDRKALPVPDTTTSDTPRRAPSNPREEILCTLFADILGVPHIGIDDNFFDLGGHSLLATRLASRIRSTLNTDLTIRTIFDHPTIHELAHALEEHTTTQHVALRPTTRPTHIPLSPAQRRLWFLNRLEGPNATYNVPMILHLRGPLDDTALDAALRDLIERHESLRTVFPEADGHPRQLILDADATGFTLHVVNTTPDDVERLTAEATAEPFDVQTDLPIRATLFHTETLHHTLVLVIHHIAADGWSMAPLTRDLETAYCSRIEATAPAWEPLPVQYADFTLWQHALLGESDDDASIAATQLAHWRNHLANLPELLDLPYDHPRPAIPTHRGDAVAFHVEPALHDALNHLARQTDTSLFMVLQAAVAILLSKHGAGTDIPLGTPIAGRTDQALDQLIGFFVNSLVLRTDLSGDPSVREVLERIRTYDLEAYGHQELPFEQLVEHLNPSRTGSHHPLFQTMLVLQNQDSGTFALPGLTVSTEPPRTGISKFDLTFGFTPTPTGDGTRSMHGALEYSTELFTQHTAETLTTRLLHLLAEVAANPDARVSALEITSAEERATLLTIGRGAQAADPRALTEPLAALFDRSARAAGATAIAVCAADGVELTYGELDERAHTLAGVLAGIGITPEDAVGVLLERSAAVVVSTLGIVRAGGVYVPFDARWPVDRIRAAARTAGVKAVVTDGVLHTHPWLVGLEADIPVLELDRSGVLISEGLKRVEPETLPYGGEHLAYAMFTSGSTGEPKAVAITHADVATLALDHAWDNGNDQAVLMHSPHAFDASTFELWTPLLRGGRIIIPPPGTLETDTLRDLVARHKVTGTFITAALFATIAAQDHTVFAGMRSICAGGDAATPGAMESVAAACPNTTVLNAYGPTETTTFAALHHVQATNTDQTQPPPIGRPLDGMRLYILDSDLNLVPRGATGELYIAGHGLARGYLNRPDLTATRFVPDPFANDGSRMYRTGDLARWTDNNDVACLGRVDRQIKLRGFRIELGEIENALLAQPEINAACVLLREDRPGVKQLVAYTVGAAEQDTDMLRAGLAQLVPEYMMPSLFVALDALPLTPNGKVDRKALPAPSVPERSVVAQARQPRGEAEQVVCGVFADVLGLPGVDPDDDFFRLGGDSILSIQVVSRVRREGLVITPRDVFTHRTPESIAAVAVPLGEEPAAERGTGVGEIPPTPIVSWLLETPGPLDGHNQTMVFQAPADADESRLVAVLQALVDHHDVLRLQLVEQEGAPPVLETLPSGAVAAGQLLRRVDVAGLDVAAVSAATREQAEAARRRLSPRTGNMLQALWFDVGAGQSGRLMLVIHHLAVDGVSWRVLAADLAAAWQGLGDPDGGHDHPHQRAAEEVDAEHGGLRSDVRRAARRLEPVGTTFKRWAELLVAEAHSAEREEELPLWQAILDTPDPLLGARPLDPAEDTAATVRTLTLELAPEWTEPLLGEVPAAWNADVNDVLLTGLALAVNARRIETGQQTTGNGVLIDLEGHGREQIVDGVDLSRTVGWFTSLFPVSLDPGPIAAHEARDLGGPLLERALKQVKEQLRQIPDHGIGYGLLRYLNPRTRAVLEGARTPQIGFNYLGRFSVDAKEAGTPEADWRIVPEPDIPRSQDPEMPAAHAIEVNAHTRVLGAGPTLVSTWTWPVGLLDEAEAHALAETWLRVLRALVEHVRNADAAGGYTPSDLPLVSISQSQLDKLQMKWSGRK